jgi:hypothetical protein
VYQLIRELRPSQRRGYQAAMAKRVAETLPEKVIGFKYDDTAREDGR